MLIPSSCSSCRMHDAVHTVIVSALHGQSTCKPPTPPRGVRSIVRAIVSAGLIRGPGGHLLGLDCQDTTLLIVCISEVSFQPNT